MKRANPSRRGAVMLEFIIAFPLILMVIFLCMQVAHIWLAKLVTRYAAFSAARSALVHVAEQSPPNVDFDSFPVQNDLPHEGLESPYRQGLSRIPAGIPQGFARSEAEWSANETARRVCAWIVSGSGSGQAVDFPGWGDIPGSESAARKTRAAVEFDNWTVEVKVEHDFGLIFPFAGPFLGWLAHSGQPGREYAVQRRDDTANAHLNLDRPGYPHIRLYETAAMSKPYRSMLAAGNY